MAEKNILGRIQQKHDIEAHWKLAVNFSPKAGEIVIYDPDETHEYPRMKIGDGVTNVNDLPFVIEPVAWASDAEALQMLEDLGMLEGVEANSLNFALMDDFMLG